MFQCPSDNSMITMTATQAQASKGIFTCAEDVASKGVIKKQAL